MKNYKITQEIERFHISKGSNSSSHVHRLPFRIIQLIPFLYSLGHRNVVKYPTQSPTGKKKSTIHTRARNSNRAPDKNDRPRGLHHFKACSCRSGYQPHVSQCCLLYLCNVCAHDALVLCCENVRKINQHQQAVVVVRS